MIKKTCHITSDQDRIYERAERLINTMNRHNIKMCNLVLIGTMDWNNIRHRFRIFLCGIAFQGVVIVFLQPLALSSGYFGQHWCHIKIFQLLVLSLNREGKIDAHIR
jgi:hypothetical protein